ncbi:MAG: phage tail tape measure protein [Proteobacteria bacterium]|nr:phage tail tape measure protein [Pseudomonadota bacterium]
MAVKDLKASFKLDLIGNLFDKTQQLSNRLARMGQTGSRSAYYLSKSLQAADMGLNKLANRYTGFITGAGGAMAVRNAASLELRLTRLGIQAEISQDEVNQLNNEIYRISQLRDININPDELLASVEKIVSKTGNLKFAEDNLQNLAYTISATGAAGNDVGAMAADLFEKFNIKDANQMIATLGMLVNQGKAGAFELRDLATQGERATSAYGQMGRTGVEAAAEMGAMLQMARKATGSPEQAATSLEAYIRNLNATEKRAKLKKAGIRLMDPEDPKRMRSAIDIAKDLIRLTKGNVEKIGSVIDAEGIKALNAMIIEYKQTGAFETVDSFVNISRESKGLLEDSARIAGTLDSSMTSLKTAWTAFANRNLAEPIQKLANALNRIQPEQLDKWLKNAAKIAVTIGTLAVANKARHGVMGIMDFFRFSAVKGGGAGSILGALGSGARPIPVYVVNGGAFGAAGMADGFDMLGGGGKNGKFGKVGRFMARHRRLAKLAGYGGKALKYGGKALGIAGMAYSVYELIQAENATQIGGSLGSIAGGLIGSIGGPLGMVAGAYIGNYLGEKIGGLFDRLPEENAKALNSDRSLALLKSENQCKISLDVNAEGANVSLRRVEDNSPENTMTSIDLSLGGRSYNAI